MRDQIQAMIIQRELAKRKLIEWTKYSFEHYDKQKFMLNWHHEYVAEHLEAVYEGEITRLIINFPPSYTKTEMTVKRFGSWGIGKRPNLKLIHTSYSADLSEKNSYQTRDIVESDAFSQVFGNGVSINPKQDKKSFWETNHHGGMFATGTGGAITGFHAHGVIIDDPTKAIEANSKAALQESIDYLEGSIYTRLQDKKKGFIIIIMQRLNPKDLVGHLLETDPNTWIHLKLKGLEDKPKIYDFRGFHYERQANEPLWIEYEGLAELENAKRSMRSKFASQYQQEPEKLEGGFYTENDFCEIGEIDIPLEEKQYIIIDPALAMGIKADNRAILTLGVSVSNNMELFVVHDVAFGIWSLADFVERIIEMCIRYPKATIFMEKSGGGIAVEQLLRVEIAKVNLKRKIAGLPLIANRIVMFAPERSVSKNERISYMENYFKNHQIKFKRSASGIEQLKIELLAFDPQKDSIKDDCMDCLARGVYDKRIFGTKIKEISISSSDSIFASMRQKKRIKEQKHWKI